MRKKYLIFLSFGLLLFSYSGVYGCKPFAEIPPTTISKSLLYTSPYTELSVEINFSQTKNTVDKQEEIIKIKITSGTYYQPTLFIDNSIINSHYLTVGTGALLGVAQNSQGTEIARFDAGPFFYTWGFLIRSGTHSAKVQFLNTETGGKLDILWHFTLQE